jgi:hypothetical protein
LAASGLLACSVQATTVINGDFETGADGFTNWPGYVGAPNPDAIPGWTGTGGHGINPGGIDHADPTPFDGGSTFNTSNFAFLQGVSSISQEISGFSVGGEFLVGIDFNARDCCGGLPVATISINDAPIGSTVDLLPDPGTVSPLGGDTPWYHADVPFIASAETITLTISAEAMGGDGTLVVDNVTISAIPEPSSSLLALFGASLLVFRRRR